MPESPRAQRARIRTDLKASLPTSYFTLISLIQGTAFGFFAAEVHANITHWQLQHWLNALGTFLILITVWNEYRMSVTLWAGVPVLQDSIIPFSLGALEFWLIFQMTHTPRWLLALTCFSLGAVIAYIHVRRLRDLHENSEMRMHRPYMDANLIWSAAYTAIFGAFTSLSHIREGAAIVGSGAAVILLIILLMRAELHWRRVLRLVDEWEDEP